MLPWGLFWSEMNGRRETVTSELSWKEWSNSFTFESRHPEVQRCWLYTDWRTDWSSKDAAVCQSYSIVSNLIFLLYFGSAIEHETAVSAELANRSTRKWLEGEGDPLIRALILWRYYIILQDFIMTTWCDFILLWWPYHFDIRVRYIWNVFGGSSLGSHHIKVEFFLD